MRDVGLNTDQEEALRFLASNPESSYPPKSIVENTSIESTSVNKVMTRLFKKNLVDREKTRYFIPERLLPDIRGVLGDLHNLQELAAEPGQTPVHPEGSIERDSKSGSPASDDEVEDLLDGCNHDTAHEFNVRPGTNEATALCFLYTNTDYGFKPAEVRDHTDIPKNSVYKALSRLHKKDLIGKTSDGYYHALDDKPVATFAEALANGEDYRIDTGKEPYPSEQ